jgi:hypothetical protein
MKTGSETVPFTVTLQETAPAAGEMAYYRLMIGTGDHRIVSNPIFIRGE